jgi:hypothetical protein
MKINHGDISKKKTKKKNTNENSNNQKIFWLPNCFGYSCKRGKMFKSANGALQTKQTKNTSIRTERRFGALFAFKMQ